MQSRGFISECCATVSGMAGRDGDASHTHQQYELDKRLNRALADLPLCRAAFDGAAAKVRGVPAYHGQPESFA